MDVVTGKKNKQLMSVNCSLVIYPPFFRPSHLGQKVIMQTLERPSVKQKTHTQNILREEITIKNSNNQVLQVI